MPRPYRGTALHPAAVHLPARPLGEPAWPGEVYITKCGRKVVGARVTDEIRLTTCRNCRTIHRI